MGAFGDKQIYKATYVLKNGLLPYGTEVQFISNKYRVEDWLFKKPLDWNFKEELVIACKRTFGIDVSKDFMPGTHPFNIESLTFQLKYKQRKLTSNKSNKSQNRGCLESLRVIFIKLLIVIIGVILIIVAAAVYCAIYE